MLNINTAEAGRGANWLLGGFDYFKGSAGTWIGVTIVLFIICIVATFIPLIGGLAFQLVSPVFLAGLILGCRNQDEGGNLGINHLFVGFSSNNVGQLILIGALYFAGVLIVLFLTAFIGVLLMGSMEFMRQISAGDMHSMAGHASNILLVALIALALYVPLLMALWFAPALVVLEHLGAVEALSMSFKGCLKNIVPFLVYGLVGLVLSILASIPIMLGWLILFPMIVASMYIAYKDIFQRVPDPVQA